MANWIPKFIPKVHEKRAGEKIHNIDWNDSFNTLVNQGNWNTETLDNLINIGNIKVRRSATSDDSLKLGGNLPEYYAARSNVIGKDEAEGSYLPSKPDHPTNKRYSDTIKVYAFDLFETYKAKYATGVTILGVFDSYADLIASKGRGRSGDAYLVDGNVYTWLESELRWYDAGPIEGPQGPIGLGLPEGGKQGQIIFKESNAAHDYKYTDYTYDEVVTSKTTSQITVSGDAPVNPKDGDLWVKL